MAAAEYVIRTLRLEITDGLMTLLETKPFQLQSEAVDIMVNCLKAALDVGLALTVLEIAASMTGHPGVLSFQFCFLLIQLH